MSDTTTDESPTDSERQFAFGKHKIRRNVMCPADTAKVSLDYDIYGASREVIEQYDRYLRDSKGEGSGIVLEDEAREAWEVAIKKVREHGKEKAAECGEKIAESLGWEV